MQPVSDNSEFVEELMDNPGRGRSATERLIKDGLGQPEPESAEALDIDQKYFKDFADNSTT